MGEMRSDAALLAAARTDSRAFRELYDRYADRVLGYHRRARASRPVRIERSTFEGGAAMTTPRLTAIGDELERAARRDLAAVRRRHVRRRRVLGGAAVLAVLIPGGALAASLLSTDE